MQENTELNEKNDKEMKKIFLREIDKFIYEIAAPCLNYYTAAVEKINRAAEKYISESIESKPEINIQEEFEIFINQLLENKFDTKIRLNKQIILHKIYSDLKEYCADVIGISDYINDSAYYIFSSINKYNMVKFLAPPPVQKLVNKVIDYYDQCKVDPNKSMDYYLEMTEEEINEIFSELYDGGIKLPFSYNVEINGNRDKLSVLYERYCRNRGQIIGNEFSESEYQLSNEDHIAHIIDSMDHMSPEEAASRLRSYGFYGDVRELREHCGSTDRAREMAKDIANGRNPLSGKNRK